MFLKESNNTIEETVYESEQDILQELEAEGVNDLLKQGYTFDRAVNIVQHCNYHNTLKCIAKREFHFYDALRSTLRGSI